VRLFLSSQDLGNYPEVARQLAGDNAKAAFIKNAQDDKPASERDFSTPEKKLMFESVGFDFEEIDLRDYFGKQDGLRGKLSSFGSVWCAGGNTFILRRAMKLSGLDEILLDSLSKDQILYGGWSAGACVTAPSLDGIQRGDRPHPDVVPDEYSIKETIWEGLDLVPFMIIPHVNMEWFIDDAKEAERYMTEKNIPFKRLEDGQVIVIDGRKVEFLS